MMSERICPLCHAWQNRKKNLIAARLELATFSVHNYVNET